MPAATASGDDSIRWIAPARRRGFHQEKRRRLCLIIPSPSLVEHTRTSFAAVNIHSEVLHPFFRRSELHGDT
jgi:hypothetical protein